MSEPRLRRKLLTLPRCERCYMSVRALRMECYLGFEDEITKAAMLDIVCRARPELQGCVILNCHFNPKPFYWEVEVEHDSFPAIEQAPTEPLIKGDDSEAWKWIIEIAYTHRLQLEAANR